jgi:RNA polymerase sigma factor (sigma-70 family)
VTRQGHGSSTRNCETESKTVSRPTSEVGPRFAASAASAFQAELDHVYRTLLRLGADPVDAEDLTQEVFLVAWRRWSHYDPQRPLRPWLTGIAHRVALDRPGRPSRREVITDELEQADERPGPDEQLSSARLRLLALQALAALPERYRSIFVLHEIDGMSMREIAGTLSVPFFTVASRLRRARARFSRAVKRLQLRSDKRRLLSPQMALAAECSAPILPVALRARLLSRLASGAGARRVPPRPPFPLAPAAAVLAGLGCLLVALLWHHARPRIADGRRASAGSAHPEPAGLAIGLVGHWRFDDGAGSTTARDSSGGSRSCLLHDLDAGRAWVKGRMGGGLDLGSAGWLECPLPEGPAGAPVELSVAAWINRERQGRFSALFSRLSPNGDRSRLFWFGLREDLLTVHSDAWPGWTSRTMTSLDGWVHVAFVHAGGQTRLYVNGVPVRVTTGRAARAGAMQGALTIGSARRRADPGGLQDHFDGIVDEARIYDRALGDAEVAALASP